ncbi:translesion DNA synthesis-associated protein ImuA [Candidimonas humi]|nr:translesion DNA synthesis-associated protein ImuA [Candidimonas humi]
MLHPERIHPALWRGSQLAQGRQATLSTGYTELDRELPGGGWPLGALVELMPCRPGIGEVQLLRPALQRLEPCRRIVLVDPPHVPDIACWQRWRLQERRLLWVCPATAADGLWAVEQILRHQACAAVLLWAGHIRSPALRRLQWLAQGSDTLCALFRPVEAAHQPSSAPLRLQLAPAPQGLSLTIVKRHGPACPHPIVLSFGGMRSRSDAASSHAALDQPLPAHAQPGRPVPELVG